MAIGAVKSFDHRKGLGVITPDDGGPDVHLHVSVVERAGLARVLAGDRVNFTTRTDQATGKTTAISLSLV